ncbi:UNVERIFIED_CONTAM: Histone-lysine N-methyltransferase EZA1 [Sesamum latifolium]|uniref:Histone-lysine N-methyltransferase EZA1 n=1 Tax=Sesamum latifolium TaxID=2727402 RepID=A0AAW2XWQ5_9LAMI
MADLTYKLTQLKRQMQSERVASVGEKLEKNCTRVQAYVSDLKALAASRNDFNAVNDSVNFLSFRMDNPLCKVSGLNQGSVDRDNVDNEEVVFSTTAKLPLIEKLPPYTTWIFLDRNQRMADDQSVVGRRRIYYDQHGSEALICSDSEEELGETEGEKHEFSEVEDRILRVALEEFGVGDEVLNTLTQFVGGTSLEIQERCNMFMEKDRIMGKHKLQGSVEEGSEDNVFLDKSLSAALDSFDNLFCRRCLVFDCRLHGCSQILIYPSEKQSFPSDTEEDRKPCGDQCYLWLNGLKDLHKRSAVPLDGSQSKASNEEAHNLESKGKHRIYESTSSLAKASKVASDDLLTSSSKRLKLGVQDPLDHSTTTVDQFSEVGPLNEHELQMSTSTPVHAFYKHNVDALREACNTIGNSIKVPHRRSEWKTFEKDLYLKGLEIFGRNSCLIARSLLPGLKTCKEVSSYMYGDGAVMPRGSSAILSSFFEDVGKADMDYLEPEMLVKSRVCRKRGRARKVKSSWKSAGHPSLWRRIADGKDQPCKQYTPCGCQSLCGKQCPCLKNGTCCEKYCGCSKSCKNRFRGCHCAKSQCKSRQCPCFAAGRECDPDVCRNCWVSCGDGSLGEPPKRGDGQCGNMRLLLRQQQRILLSKSDVAGWGAFLKNSVNKNDYLGEYTGELISHREADKRGKIYDRANSSFLFDLNDQYVLDAYRKGDKLKFANHSSTPNCYAKVMLVAGDHRVGIFANERIEAGEELFYDYRYGPDQAPAWARKPEGSSKRDDSLAPQGRAKKHQSG